MKCLTFNFECWSKHSKYLPLSNDDKIQPLCCFQHWNLTITNKLADELLKVNGNGNKLYFLMSPIFYGRNFLRYVVEKELLVEKYTNREFKLTIKVHGKKLKWW